MGLPVCVDLRQQLIPIPLCRRRHLLFDFFVQICAGLDMGSVYKHCRYPVIFAKKNKTRDIAGGVYTAKVESFTHGKVYDVIVSKDFLKPEDRVLLIDDFLANGSALQGLISLVHDAGAHLVGAGVCIEKAFQPGGDLIRAAGVRVESLARVKSMTPDGGVEFC